MSPLTAKQEAAVARERALEARRMVEAWEHVCGRATRALEAARENGDTVVLLRVLEARARNAQDQLSAAKNHEDEVWSHQPPVRPARRRT